MNDFGTYVMVGLLLTLLSTGSEQGEIMPQIEKKTIAAFFSSSTNKLSQHAHIMHSLL